MALGAFRTFLSSYACPCVVEKCVVSLVVFLLFKRGGDSSEEERGS